VAWGINTMETVSGWYTSEFDILTWSPVRSSFSMSRVERTQRQPLAEGNTTGSESESLSGEDERKRGPETDGGSKSETKSEPREESSS